jgi:kynurenine formamidase
MGRRFVDLSIAIDNDVISDPPPLRPKITYHQHGDTFHQMAPFFPGLTPEDLPDGQAWAVEDISLTTHSGTHMDAPWHYHPTSGGQRAATIDEVPLDLCFRPGVKLDFRHFADGYVATGDDVARELDRIGHALKPLDIVLVNTSAGARLGQPGFVDMGCGMGRDATLYLTERGVQVVGTDAWSWDAPFSHTARRFAETGDASLIWEGHKAGREIGYYQMEKLSNLESLPPHGFEVICFPVKIKAAGAGWTRCVAMFEH